ncbi:MAG TPA: prepilin-type N-terminal cleavage/methylation domain-containing protein [Dongiaceae bacterium]|nr:prepilin-type N-terminal cleavage/methylation domain-containing protein [Dongiaceae bacterium]
MATNQKGFSLMEMLIVAGIILLIAAIAIPSLLHGKASANQASAVTTMHALASACNTYADTYRRGYPATLSNLGPSADPDITAANLVDGMLAGGYKSGYNFVLVSGTPDASGYITTYTINANPASTASGNRYFYVDQRGVMTSSETGPATSTDAAVE